MPTAYTPSAARPAACMPVRLRTTLSNARTRRALGDTRDRLSGSHTHARAVYAHISAV